MLTTSLSAELLVLKLHCSDEACSSTPGELVETADARLPDECVRSIAAYLVAGEPPGHTLVHLLAFAGVCSQWRAVAAEVAPGVAVGFDVLDNTFCNLASIQKFRRLASERKEEVFYWAAKLLMGYNEVCFAGDAVSDRLLVAVAERAGAGLVKIKLSNTKNVTDASLCTLIQSAPRLTVFVAEELEKAAGKFLVPLFECPELSLAHVANIPGLNWGPCKAAAAAWPAAKASLTKLVVRTVNLDEYFGAILSKLGSLTEIELDGPARNVQVAARSCPALHRVSYLVGRKVDLDESLMALRFVGQLKQLELVVRNFVLSADELRVIGTLPVVDLRLDSFVYKQQPTLSRSSYSHVDNEGVKSLVDGICHRWSSASADMTPMKLSLCGATALTHDAVSALLRLPILTELDIGGCCRITAMDKMRLVAKVKAGREMLESGRRPQIRLNSRFPGLLL